MERGHCARRLVRVLTLRLVSVAKRFVVSVDGNEPFVRWQLEKGLDWTISSVAGESYRVEVRRVAVSDLLYSCCLPVTLTFFPWQVDLSDALESWARKHLHVKHAWRDASFTLKYYSDALFDFPHWFGFSKRKFSVTAATSSWYK